MCEPRPPTLNPGSSGSPKPERHEQMTDPLKLGLGTPVLCGRRASADWELQGTIEDVRLFAEAADRLGYDYLTCGEHVALPADSLDERVEVGWASSSQLATRYYDPLPAFGYLSACTSRIRLATSVLVLGYHHPLAIVKQYGTLDRISGGRLILGVGAGYLEKEFAMLGAPFADRGDRADDALRALRASFGRSQPSYSGTYYQFDGMFVDPYSIQERVPLWIGGHTPRSLRRAVELGDAWVPFDVTPLQVGEWLARAADTAAWQARETALEVLPMADPLDPSGKPGEAADAICALRDAGATGMRLQLTSKSLNHYIEQLEAMKTVLSKL
jgi:probable F420-dependent oxidoreductase